MRLNQYVGEVRAALFEDLKAGRAPSQGSLDEGLWAEARIRGAPQLGTTRFTPSEIVVEFIYPAAGTASIVLQVRAPAPERIVFLPVPEWVVESIWQGDVDGSYAFETEAVERLRAFERELSPEENLKWFGPRQATRRE